MSITTPLRDQLDDLRATLVERAGDNRKVFTDERAAQSARTPGPLPALGSPAPDGQLLDVHGAATSLASTRAGRVAVLVFYRGAWCPYCNLALRTYQEQLLPELTARGATLIAISPQKPDGALTAAEKNALDHPVLSDPGNQLAGALGILTETRPETIAVLEANGLDIAATNADETQALPMPAVVIVDAAGAIRWIDVHPDYTTRTEPADILKEIAALG